MDTQTKRLALISAGALIASGLLAIGYQYFAADHKPDMQLDVLRRWFATVFYYPVRYRIQGTVFTWAFVVVLGATLLLERIIPAQKSQRIFSISFFQDGVWFFFEAILFALVVATYVALLKKNQTPS